MILDIEKNRENIRIKPTSVYTTAKYNANNVLIEGSQHICVLGCEPIEANNSKTMKPMAFIIEDEANYGWHEIDTVYSGETFSIKSEQDCSTTLIDKITCKRNSELFNRKVPGFLENFMSKNEHSFGSLLIANQFVKIANMPKRKRAITCKCPVACKTCSCIC